MTAGRSANATVARALALPGAPQTWAGVGFAPGEPVGDVALAFGAPALELAIEGLEAECPDGLALLQAPPGPPAGRGSHPNGALAIDHVVALTNDMDRTLAALAAAGLELRRERRAPARQAFFNLRTLVLEVVEAGGAAPRLWGLTIVVEDLDALGPAVGEPRDAVQPGRRIATVPKAAGLPSALAFMTPRAPGPQRSPPT